MKKIVFNFSAFTGWSLLYNMLPKSMRVRRVARSMVKMLTDGQGNPPDVKGTPVILNMPFGSYRLTDLKGGTEQCPYEPGVY